jgi:hypothetical protein
VTTNTTASYRHSAAHKDRAAYRHSAAASFRAIGTATALLMLGVVLSGCESSTSLFGSSSSPEASLNPTQSAQPVVLTRVAIAPVIGAPDAIARQLQQDVTSALDKSKVTVVNTADAPQYTLRGYIVAAKEKSSTKVSYIWDVNDNAGKRVNRITGEEAIAGVPGKDPWSLVTQPITQTIAQKSASSFGAWLPSSPVAQAAIASVPSGVGAAGNPNSVAMNSAVNGAVNGATNGTSTQALRPQPISANGPATGSLGRDTVAAFVPAVSGAPGDGSSALTTAIQAELTKNGVSLADQSSAAPYKVEGFVKVGQPRDGKQAVQIDWQVKDPAGKKLGTVSQKNEIPEGSLDGAWGRTADAAAAAAAQGILKLLPAKAIN